MKKSHDMVREGYDKVSYAYREDSLDASSEKFLFYKGMTDEITNRLDSGSLVLDLGCGCGIPTSRLLAEKFQVTGVDISPVQIDRARKLVPNAKFLCGDMTEIEFKQDSFDAVVCLYAIIHVPLEEQLEVLKKIHKWIKPGGILLVVTGDNEWTGQEPDWLGVKGGDMFWSHTDKKTFESWLTQAGFAIQWTRFIPEDDYGHWLMFTTKSGNCT